MAKSRDSGLWMAFAGELAIKIAMSIERARQFSTSVVTSEVRPRNAELVVVHLDIEKYEREEFGINSGYYLAVSQSGRQIATGQSTVVVSNTTYVPGITTATIRKLLPRRFSRSFTLPSDGVYRPSPRLWEQLLDILGTRLPKTGVQLPDLLRATDDSRKPHGRIAGGLDVFERDAIATVIQAWRGEQMRKRVLRQAIPPGRAPVASFLKNLEHVSVREDPQIIHDQNTFPGMEVARRDIVGSVVLSDGNEFLTITNCNRQPLERTLGVDLIYYSHRYDSFVLVQYKRMSEGSDEDELEYRPSQDPNYEKELKRMVEATRMLAEVPRGAKDVDTFRLSEAPFYIKLCEPKIKAALDAGMVSGMYVPLALWRRLLASPSVRGRRGQVKSFVRHY